MIHFLNGSLVKLRDARPPPNPHPLGFDMNPICEFHSGAYGYTIKNYKVFRYKV